MSDKKQLREFIKAEINFQKHLDESVWSGFKKMFTSASLTPQAKKQIVDIGALFDSQSDFSRFQNRLERVALVTGKEMTFADFLRGVKNVEGVNLPNKFWSGDYDENEFEDIIGSLHRRKRRSRRKK